MASPDMTALFQAGAHYGHKTSRWHPKMAPYIHSARGGIHIIDLAKTAELLDLALEFLAATASEGKQVLLVGTKRQAVPAVEQAAETTGMPYVTIRWFGGLLTNFKTMQARVKHLKSLEEKMESGELANRYSKLEVQRFSEEIERLNASFGGIKNMQGMPGAVFITDAKNNGLAVQEANKLGIPVVAIVDSNVDPTNIDYPIPANDDAIKSVTLIVESVTEALARGKASPKTKAKADEAPEAKPRAAAKTEPAKPKSETKTPKSAAKTTKTKKEA